MSPSRTNTQSMTRWVVVLTAIGSLMAALDTLVVSTALSTIRLDLGATVEQLEWTVNAYNLSFAVLLVTGAALGDRTGLAVASGPLVGAAGGYASAPSFTYGLTPAMPLAPGCRRPGWSRPGDCEDAAGRGRPPRSAPSRHSRRRPDAPSRTPVTGRERAPARSTVRCTIRTTSGSSSPTEPSCARTATACSARRTTPRTRSRR